MFNNTGCFLIVLKNFALRNSYSVYSIFQMSGVRTKVLTKEQIPEVLENPLDDDDDI